MTKRELAQDLVPSYKKKTRVKVTEKNSVKTMSKIYKPPSIIACGVNNIQQLISRLKLATNKDIAMNSLKLLLMVT